MADDILKNIPLPADLPENWTSQQTVAPTGAEVGMDEQHGYNYLMKQVNNAQRALKALAAQREEDLARIKFWFSDDPTSPAELFGGTWERIEDCTIWGASDTHPAGTKLEAGLPNIAAQVNDMLFSSSEPYITSDVFKPLFNGFINGYVSESGSSGVYRSNVQLKASLGNSIYGNSTTVQPPASCMYIWRRVA